MSLPRKVIRRLRKRTAMGILCKMQNKLWEMYVDAPDDEAPDFLQALLILQSCLSQVLREEEKSRL